MWLNWIQLNVPKTLGPCRSKYILSLPKVKVLKESTENTKNKSMFLGKKTFLNSRHYHIGFLQGWQQCHMFIFCSVVMEISLLMWMFCSWEDFSCCQDFISNLMKSIIISLKKVWKKVSRTWVESCFVYLLSKALVENVVAWHSATVFFQALKCTFDGGSKIYINICKFKEKSLIWILFAIRASFVSASVLSTYYINQTLFIQHLSN